MVTMKKSKILSKSGYVIAKNYNPPFDYPDGTKFYTNPEMDIKIDKLLENCALKRKNKCEITFKNAIHKINNINQNNNGKEKKRWCFIAGGVIRDIMHDLKPKDVDLKFTFIDKNTLEKKCKQWSWPCVSVYGSNDSWSYIKFMEDQPDGFEGLEGMSFHKKYALRFFENNVNALMYDVENKVFVDFFGNGVEDNLKHKFRLPDDLKNWSSNNSDRLKCIIRVFKMFAKGYTFYHRDVKRFNKLFMYELESLTGDYPPYLKGVSIINQELLKKVRGDTLKNNRIVKKGKNHKKLQEVLSAVKKFNEEIYDIIIREIKQLDEDFTLAESLKRTLKTRKRGKRAKNKSRKKRGIKR